MTKKRASTILYILLIPAFLFLLVSALYYKENKNFSDFTHKMFQTEITKNTLNLHYTLSSPEKYGIQTTAVTLGDASPDSLEEGMDALKNYQVLLAGISSKWLSRSNRLTYDILCSALETQLEGAGFSLYPEPLGPTIGTQAQLPVLLAEYEFRELSDIQDYLLLLSQMDTYYASLLDYEQAKARAGLFMSDACADGVIAQCQAFLNEKENFLVPVFKEKLKNFPQLSQADADKFMQTHQQLIEQHVLPAYQLLMDGLTALKGSGKNTVGLAGLPEGREYYEYLVKDTTGSSLTISQLEQRIQKQLRSDFAELSALVKEHSEVLTTQAGATDLQEPDEILWDLKEKLSKDFPVPPSVSCSVKYVHPSLEAFLSPAFYLTPPVDDLSSNVIYINQSSGYSPLALYTTLAHEGYPGHLYQTIYSGSIPSNPVRSLLNFGGYTEGWATYVELYSYSLADVDASLASMYRLDRSITLGLSSILDIAVHYHGYTRSQVASYLSQIGFRDANMADTLYDTLLEAPANYLKYYVGYLSFMDLRDAVKLKKGEEFDLKEFHREVLEIGPAPFHVLEKHLLSL